MRWATSPGEVTERAGSDRCATGLCRAAGLRKTIAFARGSQRRGMLCQRLGMLHNKTNGSQSGALLVPKNGPLRGHGQNGFGVNLKGPGLMDGQMGGRA